MSEEPSSPAQPGSLPLRRNLAILGAVVGTFLLLVFMTVVGLRALTSVRGYVMGEGLWSKAQKRATLALHRYAGTGDEAYLARFREEIDVTLGDRQARIELQSADPDMARIREGFRRGRIPAEVIDGMAWLFRTFHRAEEIRRSLDIWRQGDVAIDQLVELQRRLRAAVLDGGPDSPEAAGLLRQIDAVDEHLTGLENAFTQSLHQGANRVEGILLWLLVGMALGFSASAILGGTYIYRQLRSREAAAHRSEARYRSLFQQNVVGVAVVTRAGEILEANPAFARLFGFDDPDELRRTWRVEDLYAQPEQRRDVLGHLTEHGSLLTRTLQVRRRDGTTAWASVSSVVVADPETGEERILSSAADITDQKRLEEQIVAVRRMEAMGQLAGGIAHDFNNLLTAIQANASLLAEDLEDADGRAKDEVQEILDAADSASGLTRQLLTFSRGQAPDVEALDLDLAINARDAMPDGGVLELSTDAVEVDDTEGEALGLPPGPYVRILMRDTGVGMTPEVKARIFEPFFTTRGEAGGTGMGLATVYGVVTQAGGTVDVSSAPDQGSTSTPYIPRSSQPRQADTSAAPRGEVGSGQSDVHARILLVEDDDAVRRVIHRTLERMGFVVLEAPDARTALSFFESGHDVDMILTDVIMPDDNGPRLVQEIRERYRAVPVLYMSGYLDRSLTNEEMKRPDTDFLGKPFEPQELSKAIAELRGRVGG